MKRFYSQSTGCAYLCGIHEVIPSDAVEISAERYDVVIANPAQGKIRAHDAEGLPILIDPVHDAEGQERQWRDGELKSVMWLRERHRDQVEDSAPSALTAEQFTELLRYMQDLRDWPQSPDFPEIVHRPIAPHWIAEQNQ